MKKLDIDSIKRFIEYRKSNKETVFNLFVLNLFACAIIFIIGYDYVKSVLVLLPFIVVAFIIFIVYKFIKKTQHRTTDLFCGMEGMILTGICQSAIYLFVPKRFLDIIDLLILSSILNLLIMLFITWFSINWVSSKRSVTNTPVSIAIIFLTVVIGISIFRKVDNNFILPFCAIGLSCVSSILFVYIIKYFFAKLVKKIEENTDQTQGDGSSVS